jgi:hypothetical protein
MIAATYWFAAQALAGSLGIQAVVVALGGAKPPLVPVALALAVFHATLAVLGLDVMRYVLRASTRVGESRVGPRRGRDHYLALEPIQQTLLARSGRDQATAEAA